MDNKVAVMMNELHHTNDDIAELKREIDELKKWKESCSIWAARWAGVCAAIMTLAGLLQTYWDNIHNYIVGSK